MHLSRSSDGTFIDSWKQNSLQLYFTVLIHQISFIWIIAVETARVRLRVYVERSRKSRRQVASARCTDNPWIRYICANICREAAGNFIFRVYKKKCNWGPEECKNSVNSGKRSRPKIVLVTYNEVVHSKHTVHRISTKHLSRKSMGFLRLHTCTDTRFVRRLVLLLRMYADQSIRSLHLVETLL